ncbi:hypothetical protein HD806DRAFT_465443 [Xylariaceae sp. AK1471]|nr:hypothetical protein HD806DRAFT_465443 [Xylariaceae sp. AK1471]
MAERNLILSFPPEIRNIIYEYAVVDVISKLIIWKPPYRTCLAPPALAQVNRQLRNEVIPAYYGKNIWGVFLSAELSLELAQAYDPDSNDEVGGEGPFGLSKWYYDGEDSFSQMCNCLKEHLQYVTQILVCHDEIVNGIYVKMGFKVERVKNEESMSTGHRIGDDETDWSISHNVRSLFVAAAPDVLSAVEPLPVDEWMVASALALLAPHCMSAQKRITFFWVDFAWSDDSADKSGASDEEHDFEDDPESPEEYDSDFLTSEDDLYDDNDDEVTE